MVIVGARSPFRGRYHCRGFAGKWGSYHRRGRPFGDASPHIERKDPALRLAWDRRLKQAEFRPIRSVAGGFPPTIGVPPLLADGQAIENSPASWFSGTWHEAC